MRTQNVSKSTPQSTPERHDTPHEDTASIVHVDAPFGSDPLTTRDGSATLVHPIYDQTYHSHHGAITESKHVFLGHSDLAERLTHGAVHLLEIGVGTGLNLVLSATLAQRQQNALHYVGIEQFPPKDSDLAHLNYDQDEGVDAEFWSACRAHFHARTPRWTLPPTGDHPASTIQCHWGRLEDYAFPHAYFDIVYHDAFSPDVNPECWSQAVLARITDALKPGGVLVTYSVQGKVRRALAACGLIVERLPGPSDGKRQVLRATKPPN